MPRVYKTKPGSKKRTPINVSNLRNAIKAYLYDGKSLRSSARMFNVSIMTLQRYAAIQKDKKQEINYLRCNRSKIFTDEEEIQLVNYALKKSEQNGDLTSKVMRKLAFEFGTLKNKKMPPNWLKNAEAGYDWMWGFTNRHKELLLCVPEAIKLRRYNTNEEREKCENYETILNTEIKLEVSDSAVINETLEDADNSETSYHEENSQEQENGNNSKIQKIFLRSLPELEELLSSNSVESGLGLGPVTEIHKTELADSEKGSNCLREPRNEFDAFCESLAIQLKNMPLRQALLCQEKLLKVMIEARLQFVKE